MVLFIAPNPVVKLIKEIAVGAVVAVFVIVRLLSVSPELLPSMVTKSAPFSLIKALLATEPEIVAVTPVAGLMVRVLIPAIALELIVIGNVSLPP